MRRLRSAPARVAAAGFALLFTGAALVLSVAAQTSASAQTLTGPYELFCPGTPVGSIALNDATTMGTISPAGVSAGGTFNVSNYQISVALPAALASAAAAVSPGQPLTGSATGQLDVTGGSPATLSTGTLNFSVTIPSPVPASGLALTVPSTPGTIGPFTASSGAITVAEDSSTTLTLIVAGSPLTLTCTAFPNDSVTPSGITTAAEPTDPLSPIIAEQSGSTTTTTGATTTTTQATTTSTSPQQTTTTTTPGTTTTTTPGTALTGAYELYCPGTPVGNIVLNDATTVANITPSSPNAGDSFNLTGYQTTVNLPAALASAAAAVSPGQPLTGSATGQVDVAGGTPATFSTGTLSFSVNIPSPVPASGLALQVPSTPTTLGPFTATSSNITAQADSATSLTLIVAGSPLTLTCTSFPNDSVTPTGITTSPEPTDPIKPVIAVAAASTSTTTTPSSTTTSAPGTTTTTAPPATTTTVGATTTTSGGTTTTTAAGGTTTTAAHGTTTTAAATGSGGTSPTTSGAQPVTASSGALAFTGSGLGLQTTMLIGLALMIIGVVALFLVDLPRHVARQFATLGPRGHMTHLAAGVRSLAKSTGNSVVRSVLWMLGR